MDTVNHIVTAAQITAKIDQIAQEIYRTNTGATYEMLSDSFTSAILATLPIIPEQLHEVALERAAYHGFEQPGEQDQDDDSFYASNTCSRTGINANCCHCGNHP